ncbi:GNAT family N-acetyltransferase [Flavobacterium sp. '19STA2R22 D10 B1']|uniref:GNAT family N-acetyltransferase n=1 Tax=Flavobacterium aerium TaxID=3037261 RepID=UPI00278C3F8A|nr:GNAT family protein [Flavobacterium sp. '19STA2R22 D10 B1']
MIKLELFEREDFDRLIGWIPNEELLMQFAGPDFTYPLTTTQLEKYVDNPNAKIFKVVEIDSNTVVGHAELMVNNKNLVKLCRILVGSTAHRGKGLGQQIINALLEYSFTQLEYTKAELNVFDWNTSAIKCYEKVGFVINPSATRVTHFKENEWLAINMLIDKVDWQGNLR